ncbi:hypothetical protein ERO13_D11G100000v2 [Gossypium hirsutum]|uniref:3-phosphoinositide-dependent protein kinase B isoform X1 n=2 Tax=Gossypium hirsutum TaxID=3635 RepID=A0A1U8L6M4_GOSHI|nr:3-phosphoinositide-dependent protein kinase B-like isoform X1 [Gossypium hirsutum]XP_040961858.1 3-phosphoinositide-dependent protein kinase B-like isoform X1 [Gossypium hirsutum]KAG4119753.1 hypothetical protein ERO13_D11G100000v2 [Gossypium hirsutum]KAG4119754.1 hypothetical protein ERO13_D11G100000v2 [Gossypium hirsutum]
MEQFRQIGEALGSLKALMVFRDNIQINQRQCILLLDIFYSAYKSIADEMKDNLKFEERNLKWKVLEMPLRELHRIFKEGEAYIKESLESKDWWVKAITLYQNTDCVELHISNLLSCIPVVIEAIESAAQLSGWEQDEMQKKKRVYSNKYHKEWIDPELFQWKFAKQYLVTQDFCNRIDNVWKEDRWILKNKIQEKENSRFRKQERKLADLLLRNLDSSKSLKDKLLPSSILLGWKDYQVRRRLGNGSQYKEVYWLGESFILRHIIGDVEAVASDISSLLSLSHPNILHFLCGFTDEEKKECLLVMELAHKSLCDCIKETCGPRKRTSFCLPVTVDLMLQIARGMEYLHSNKIYHGDLNPSSIYVKLRGTSSEGYMQVKVSGFGLSSIPQRGAANQNETQSFIWHAPEVLEEQEQPGSKVKLKFTGKADVYSFGMICFQLLTGKVPFEDGHLQGDKMSRNIRAGERPLFPFKPPKSITSLIKRCWHADPDLRPSFLSICRILRYIKRSLLMNPDYNSQSELPEPLVDYCDIDMRLQRIFPTWETPNPLSTSQIPFQMFVYRVLEKDKTGVPLKDTSESGSDRNSASGDENVTTDELYTSATDRSMPSPEPLPRINTTMKKSADIRTKHPVTPKARSTRPPTNQRVRSFRMSSESQLLLVSPRLRRSSSGHVSDSELS